MKTDKYRGKTWKEEIGEIGGQDKVRENQKKKREKKRKHVVWRDDWLIDWLIDFNGMSTHLRLFYAITNPSTQTGCDTRLVFKQRLTGLNSEFSFSKIGCHTKVKEPSLPYYLPIASGSIIGYIPFPWVLALLEIQTVSSRIWTCVTVSISYDGNNYIMNTSSLFHAQMFGNHVHYSYLHFLRSCFFRIFLPMILLSKNNFKQIYLIHIWLEWIWE